MCIKYITEMDAVLETKKNEALQFFRDLPNIETEDEEKYGDKLFQQYGLGNTLDTIQNPFERLDYYKVLLQEMQAADSEKYKNLHKGTPFYFMAWLAFDMNNFDQALFYIDSAIAEDKIHRPLNWQNSAAIQFYTLKNDHPQSTRTVKKIKDTLTNEIYRFSILTTNPNFNLENFIEFFVDKIIDSTDDSKRSLISAFYCFLLEFQHLYSILTLRSHHICSILPYIVHLFKGAAICETLLKEFYNGQTIGSIFNNNTSNFRQDFGINTNIDTSAHSIEEIHLSLQESSYNQSSLNVAFSTTAKIRNTTAHKLLWDDIFSEPLKYKELFEQEVNAIFHLITKKYFTP